jgi:hypothetical protein
MYVFTSWQFIAIHTYFFNVVLWLIVNVIDRFSFFLIFVKNILFISLWLITSITDSLFIKDQITLMFLNQMMMNMSAISSSFCKTLVIIMSVLIRASLITFFVVVAAFLTRYRDVEICRLQTNFFLNCWLSFNNCFMSKLIIKFIIFCMSNRFLFRIARIEFDIFIFLNIINSRLTVK